MDLVVLLAPESPNCLFYSILICIVMLLPAHICIVTIPP